MNSIQYISIGPNCNVRDQIDKQRAKKATLMFDYVLTNNQTILEVFESQKIESIFTAKNVEIVKEEENGMVHARVRGLSNFYCIHDLHRGFSDSCIQSFCDKYIRRFHRMCEHISSDTKIAFLRYDQMKDEEAEKFIALVKEKNPICKFMLVVINATEDILSAENQVNENLLRISARYVAETRTPADADWTYIFNSIDRHLQNL